MSYKKLAVVVLWSEKRFRYTNKEANKKKKEKDAFFLFVLFRHATKINKKISTSEILPWQNKSPQVLAKKSPQVLEKIWSEPGKGPPR
jgi:hypothetical protein